MTEIERLIFSKVDLEALSKKERSILLLMGHAINEIMVIQKLMMMIDKSVQPDIALERANIGQAFILFRILLGKLHEAWELYRKRVRGDAEIRDKFESHLDVEARKNRDRLNKYFGNSNHIAFIRNNLSFHYADGNNLFEDHFDNMSEDSSWEVYVGKTTGNTFFYMSEMVAMAAMTGRLEVSRDYHQKDYDDLLDQALEVASGLVQLFSVLCGKVIEENIPNRNFQKIDLQVLPKASQIKMPYFLDEDDLAKMD